MRARRMSCAQESVEPEPQVEAKSLQSSTVRSLSGGTTAASAAPTKCGVFQSGEPSTRQAQVKATLSSSSNDSGEPEETIDKEEQLVHEEHVPAWKKETWCCVENMPRESWLRRRRKHWPDQSKSTVFMHSCDKIEEEGRCDWLVHTKLHDERRHHFPGRRNTLIILP